MSQEADFSLSTPLRRVIERSTVVGYHEGEALHLQDFLADMASDKAEAIQAALSAHIVAMEYGNTRALTNTARDLRQLLKEAKEQQNSDNDPVVWANTIVGLINQCIDKELERNDQRAQTELQ